MAMYLKKGGGETFLAIKRRHRKAVQKKKESLGVLDVRIRTTLLGLSKGVMDHRGLLYRLKLRDSFSVAFSKKDPVAIRLASPVAVSKTISAFVCNTSKITYDVTQNDRLGLDALSHLLFHHVKVNSPEDVRLEVTWLFYESLFLGRQLGGDEIPCRTPPEA